MSKTVMDDLVFGQMLLDDGYRADAVVGTTYSLDLETLISLPFTLGFMEEPDQAMLQSKSALFAALNLCSDKLAIFCNTSCISVPKSSRKVLYPLLENSIFNISLGGKGKIVNFHPKVWIIKESPDGGGPSRIRVIVMSRNLTSDNSLDEVCEMSGEIGEREYGSSVLKHQPLCDFLEFLSNKTDSTVAARQKRKMIKGLIDDIRHVRKFDIEGSFFDDYEFIPMGFGDYSGEEALQYISGNYETVVMSPFIDVPTLSEFKNIYKKVLVTQEQSVTPEVLDIFPKENIYTVRPGMVYNDDEVNVNLHAKMYFLTDRENLYHHMFLGSTNATVNGFHNNVEFLLKLRFRPFTFSYDSFKDGLIDAEKFTQFSGIQPCQDNRQKEYQDTVKLRRTISNLTEATVVSKENDRYDIMLKSRNDDPESKVRPLMCPEVRDVPVTQEMIFHDLPLESLSQFYIVSTSELSTVVKIETRGIPEGRDMAICRKVMGKGDFMDCIAMILSDSKKAYMVRKQAMENLFSSDDTVSYGDTVLPAIYEDLLRTSYERPEVLEDIQKLMSTMAPELIDDRFRGVYESLVKSIKHARR